MTLRSKVQKDTGEVSLDGAASLVSDAYLRGLILGITLQGESPAS